MTAQKCCGTLGSAPTERAQAGLQADDSRCTSQTEVQYLRAVGRSALNDAPLGHTSFQEILWVLVINTLAPPVVMEWPHSGLFAVGREEAALIRAGQH